MKKLFVLVIISFFISCSSTPKFENLTGSEKIFFNSTQKTESSYLIINETDYSSIDDNDDNINRIKNFFAEQRFQTNIIYPLPSKKFDSSILPNSFISFKGYTGQGVIYFHLKNIKSISLYLNGKKINTNQIYKKEYCKLFIGTLTNDGDNFLMLTNLEKQDKNKEYFLNIKIPYPKIINTNLKENKNINYRGIEIVDDLIKTEIKNGFPSAQLVIVKDGKLIKNSAYGFISTVNEFGEPLPVSKRKKVSSETLFDLASNTKMFATNFALQRLVSEGKISLYDKVQDFFPKFKDKKRAKHKGKGEITINDLLKHQSGLPAGKNYSFKKAITKKKKKEKRSNKEITLDLICETPLIFDPRTKALYSDINYMLLGFIIEKITKMPLDEYVEENIYKPLGLDLICYKPLQKDFKKDNIAATEITGIKRTKKQKHFGKKYLPVHGVVHDYEAFKAMEEVSGHAGLFANAKTLAVLAQTILNGGGYDTTRLFDAEVLNLFTSTSNLLSVTGLGWRRQGAYKSYAWGFSKLASTETIGHTGWTGTFAQIDLGKNMVIVILTSAKNTPALHGRRLRGKYEGDFYLVKKYGALTSFIYAAFNNYSNQVLDKMLIELAMERFNLYKNYPSVYNNPGFKKDLKAVIATIKKQSKKSLRLKFFLRSKIAKQINKIKI